MSLSKLNQGLIVVSGLMIFNVNAFLATLTIDATDDIYAAGHSTLPVPSGTGMGGCNFVITNGPDGPCWPGVNTTVTSYGGLSGIDVNQNNMFLVGVFLDASEPSGPGPAVLMYNYGTPGGLNTTDPGFAPGLDQVFFF